MMNFALIQLVAPPPRPCCSARSATASGAIRCAILEFGVYIIIITKPDLLWKTIRIPSERNPRPRSTCRSLIDLDEMSLILATFQSRSRLTIFRLDASGVHLRFIDGACGADVLHVREPRCHAGRDLYLKR